MLRPPLFFVVDALKGKVERAAPRASELTSEMSALREAVVRVHERLGVGRDAHWRDVATMLWVMRSMRARVSELELVVRELEGADDLLGGDGWTIEPVS